MSNSDVYIQFQSQKQSDGNGEAEGVGPAVPRAHRPHGLRPPGEVCPVDRAFLGHREKRREVDQGKAGLGLFCLLFPIERLREFRAY